MASSLKQPKFLSGIKAPADQTISPATVIDDGQPDAAQGFGLGLLSRYTITKQLQILGAILILVMLIGAAVVYYGHRESTHGSVYIATAGEMRMLSQRLAKASTLALQGNASAFKQLRESHGQFAANLDRLTNGGKLADTTVPPSPDAVQPQLQALTKVWSATDKDATQMLDMENYLVSLSKDVLTITSKNAHMLDLAEQVAALKLQAGAGARDIAAANQLVMLTQRIAKNASALLVGDEISPQVPSQMGKDTNTFRDLLKALTQGSDTLRIAATTDVETKANLNQLETSFKEYQEAVNGILGSMQRLIVAKQAGSKIFRDSEELLEVTDKLAQAYQQGIGERALYGLTLAALIFIAFATLFMMARVYLDDTRRQAANTRRQAAAAESSRQVSETVNRQNQDAILRLMNELGDLADGDLTVTATVSEDITGAIADSINYTIEELRVLVRRINDAAGRVTVATGIAQQTSAELLDAAKRQSVEIQDAGHSVLAMASSMTLVSTEASQSAQVARQSLAAAGKGAQAVQDSIKGMNEIREQIQETSKRIKRLGESSQEIGEIVELISDITEQTNVLALNAAIQAASAGDAGRGFTVVAEEVQRLAERSGEATKQIAAIVKTIQTDTQGAVSAMEESTRGVVDGAKLSDAAGQALSEIGDVSHNLAELIASISDATRHQAESATGVADRMQGILRVTEQTTAGTQRTALAVGELAGLATELKGSVAGFKVG
jgi:twitching motility protein PilJ